MDEQNLGWVIFDLPGEKVNKLTTPVMETLRELLDQALRKDVRGLAFVSDKPDMFVAGADGEDGIGGLRATIMCGSDGHRGWLYYLAVDQGRRHGGVARGMVRYAEDWLAGQGIGKVELMIRPENDAVRAFYERVGYEVEPRLVMSRRLQDDA